MENKIALLLSFYYNDYIGDVDCNEKELKKSELLKFCYARCLKKDISINKEMVLDEFLKIDINKKNEKLIKLIGLELYKKTDYRTFEKKDYNILAKFFSHVKRFVIGESGELSEEIQGWLEVLYTDFLLGTKGFSEAKNFYLTIRSKNRLLLKASSNIFSSSHQDIINSYFVLEFVDSVLEQTQQGYEFLNNRGEQRFFDDKIPVFMFWDKNFDNAPEIAQLCLKKLWESFPNEHSQLIELSDINLENFITIPEQIKNIKEQYPAHYSDYVRVALLSRYGGIWLDSTVLMKKDTISKIIEQLDSESLFVFHYDESEYISSWLLGVKNENHYIIEMLKSIIERFWEKYDSLPDYFLFHSIFKTLVYIDRKFNSIWSHSVKRTTGNSSIGVVQLSKYVEEGVCSFNNQRWISNIAQKYNRKSRFANVSETYARILLGEPPVICIGFDTQKIYFADCTDGRKELEIFVKNAQSNSIVPFQIVPKEDNIFSINLAQLVEKLPIKFNKEVWQFFSKINGQVSQIPLFSKQKISEISATFKDIKGGVNRDIRIAPYQTEDHSLALWCQDLSLRDQQYITKNKVTFNYIEETTGHDTEQKLIVCFPHNLPGGLPQKNSEYAYHYRNILKNVSATKIFIRDSNGKYGTWFIGQNGEKNLIDETLEFLNAKILEHGVKKENVILFGASKGGYNALLFGFLLGVGTVIATSPITKLADFIINNRPNLKEILPAEITKSIENEYDTLLFNIIMEKVQKNKDYPEIYIISSEKDELHEAHVPPLIDILDSENIKYSYYLNKNPQIDCHNVVLKYSINEVLTIFSHLTGNKTLRLL